MEAFARTSHYQFPPPIQTLPSNPILSLQWSDLFSRDLIILVENPQYLERDLNGAGKLLYFTPILLPTEKILWRQDYRDWRTNHAWPRGRFRLTEEIMISGWVGALRTRGLDFITERGLVVDEVRFWDNDPTDQKFCHFHPQLCPNMAFLLGNPLYYFTFHCITLRFFWTPSVELNVG